MALSEFGFDELPEGSILLAVRVGLPNGRLKTTDMIHYVWPVEGGVKMRARFWITREFEALVSGFRVAAALADNSVLKQILAPKNLPQELALHCANEYSQLAAFYLRCMAITQKCINECRVEAMDAPKSAI